MTNNQHTPNTLPDRREFLKKSAALIAAASLPTLTFADNNKQIALDDDLRNYDFLLPRVQFDCDHRVEARWSVYPGADYNLLYEFSRAVRCKVKLPKSCKNTKPENGDPNHFNAVVDFSDPDQLKKFPFLFMTAEGRYSLNSEKKQNLKQYLEQGGFLLMDDCVYKKGGDFFYRSSANLLADLFGEKSLTNVPSDHEIFHNVFNLGDVGLPYFHGQNYGPKGLFIGDRLAVFLSSTDVHCGWAACKSKSNPIYNQCIQFGVNLIMYALSH